MWGLNLALTKMRAVGEDPHVLVWSFPEKKIKNPLLPRNLLLTRWKATELFFLSLSPMAVQTTKGPGPPHCPGFTITHTQTHTHTLSLGRIPLDDRSDRRRDLYLTTHNTHNRHSCFCRYSNSQPSKRAAADPRLSAATEIGFTDTLSLCDT
jgi:hypothetical protein